MRAAPPHIAYTDGIVEILDQTRLPAEMIVVKLRSVQRVIDAIRGLKVRGAPAIGIVGAYGMCIAARAAGGVARNADDFFKVLDDAGRAIASARPTAVNLSWAIEKMKRHGRELSATGQGVMQLVAALEDMARSIHADDVATCRAIGDAGASLLPSGAVVYTHCNTGTLATGGYGTALGVVRSAWQAGFLKHVFVGETRPMLQGARLTAWELARDGIPFTLVTDSMAASLMRRGEISAVVVGADRIARNGDVANKIGTYGLALSASAHELPFYVAAPNSSIDAAIASGSEIIIEERDGLEVLECAGVRIAPAEAQAANPAFDVTPAALISAIITETGVLRPPFEAAIVAAVAGGGAANAIA
ncbi:MAG TPA: S-methyl-5-thioribose-1-phosphate isomerase [Candidatus Eremiobacteraceae bacterium]|nr:S-methyl-5-thioribose-1-phosphate isomerase [Candidatus Eremiobacteraceae bacterium]